MRPGLGSDHHHARGAASAPDAVLHVRRRLLRVGHGPVREPERLQREDHRPAGAGGGALDVVALDLCDGDRTIGGDPERALRSEPGVGHLERRDRQAGRGAPTPICAPASLAQTGPSAVDCDCWSSTFDEVGALAGHEEAGGGRFIGGHVVGLQRVEEATDDVAALRLRQRAGRRRAPAEATNLYFRGAVFCAGARRGVMRGIFFDPSGGGAVAAAQLRPSAAVAHSPNAAAPNDRMWMWGERSPGARCATPLARWLRHGCATAAATRPPRFRSNMSSECHIQRAGRATSYQHERSVISRRKKMNDEPCQAQCARATIFPRWYVRRS